MREWFEIAGILVLVMLVLLVLACGAETAAQHASLSEHFATIDEVRKALAIAPPESNEGIVRLATEWNGTIATNKAYNKKWWACWAVPNSWDNVKPITIPAK